ncbi:MAG: type II toxin-antitoxin system RelB/DinJ family antitoxin [Acinetobacter sp.]
MSNVNFRVDDELKKRAYAVLNDLGVTPSALFKSVLQYVADTGKLPVQHVVLSEEDAKLLGQIRQHQAIPNLESTELR